MVFWKNVKEESWLPTRKWKIDNSHIPVIFQKSLYKKKNLNLKIQVSKLLWSAINLTSREKGGQQDGFYDRSDKRQRWNENQNWLLEWGSNAKIIGGRPNAKGSKTSNDGGIKELQKNLI